MAIHLRPVQCLSNKLSFALLFVLVPCALSCQSLIYDGTRRQPSIDEIAGIWVPDQKSLDYLRLEKGYDTNTEIRIRFERDQTYQLINMPDLWWYGGNSRRGFRTSSGTFEVLQNVETPYWTLILQDHEDRRGLELLGQRPPFRMRVNFASVDNQPEYLTFVKTAS